MSTKALEGVDVSAIVEAFAEGRTIVDGAIVCTDFTLNSEYRVFDLDNGDRLTLPGKCELGAKRFSIQRKWRRERKEPNP